MDNIVLRPANIKDIYHLIVYCEIFSLDTEDIDENSFIVAEHEKQIVGFGRLKKYKNFQELASVGVLEEYRKKQIGKKIVDKLIEQASLNELWLTTKIPEYFEKFGFKKHDNPPEELKCKCDRVCKAVSGSTEDAVYMIKKIG